MEIGHPRVRPDHDTLDAGLGRNLLALSLGGGASSPTSNRMIELDFATPNSSAELFPIHQ